MEWKQRRVCVFCGSSSGARASYVAAAVELGEQLARRGLGLVYGGARAGLMGAVADAALRAGAAVDGVIPKSLYDREVAHEGLRSLSITDDMHQRKRQMAEQSDAFIALPGGLGTLEELAEAATWTQLRLQDKPVGLLDIEGYYQPLLAFLDHAVREGFLKPEQRALLVVANTPERMLDGLEAWQQRPRKRADVV